MQIYSGLDCLSITNIGGHQSSNDAGFITPYPSNAIDRKYSCQLSADGAQERLPKIDRYKLLNNPSKYHQLQRPIG